MITFFINAVKIIFLLGLLVFIHEGGHFFIAKLCNIKVNEFALGFGPTIWKKQGKETKYALRLIPLGGFVSMEGENEKSEHERAFSKTSIPKRIAVVAAGGTVNIIFGLIIYFCLTSFFGNSISYGLKETIDFSLAIVQNVKQLLIGGVSTDQLMGPVGISSVVSSTQGFTEYIYILALISLSLGVTNLLPFPPLDGGKIVLLIIEAIRRKTLPEKVETYIQMTGFVVLITLSIYIAYNDVLRIF